MGNPRQKRKLRAGHVKKQTARQAKKRSERQRTTKVQIQNSTIARAWDPKKSLLDNFRELGLVVDTNVDLSGDAHRQKLRGGGITAPAREPTEVVRELEQRAASVKTYKTFAARGEIIFIQSCIQKHGLDYDAMAKDLKLNTYQHTANQLQRKVNKYVETLHRMLEVSNTESLESAVEEAAANDRGKPKA
ncbi:uncharacterized protein MONBRDRAFT_33025 [Monosiga brevicollis MX1]|uniref:Nucleolar protein 16 n=1 Tax=Monosiga brevicollis TaxID=81824 RepID=A9V334_MONBE|nr:uncharacterized protein MONBRDRAFT_33025 [Monosiga brevicollis MX1]EDQ88119.1 predicted protein [Monosiga brevicollis MX1]|eukprot:XP_001747195.1 hypothetical protein [Monosiga brevicollis MX1]